jgi:hypothetical protein
MPIFSRRRIQQMLDEIRPLTDENKINDLLGRLRKKKPEQVIGAEMELSLLVGIKDVAEIEIEKHIPNSSRVPEAYSFDLFEKPAYIEVTTISDGKLSGEQCMRRAAQIISDEVKKTRKKLGNYLYFSFGEKRSFSSGRNFFSGRTLLREQNVSEKFELSRLMKEQLKNWIENGNENKSRLILQDSTISVSIEIKEQKQTQGFNFFSPLPPLAYDIENNPIYSALESKRDQLSNVPDDVLRVIFLADGGSRVLRYLNERDHLRQYKSGEEIIRHFINKRNVDVVCTFSPYRPNGFHFILPKLTWNVSFFIKEGLKIDTSKLERIAKNLPPPSFEGYQARSLQKQGAYSISARGWYLGYEMTTGVNKVTIKFSARLFQDFLAGKIDKEYFIRQAAGNGEGENLFELWLSQGLIISNAQFEKAGIDEDDDYMVLEFSHDPSASEFK